MTPAIGMQKVPVNRFVQAVVLFCVVRSGPAVGGNEVGVGLHPWYWQRPWGVNRNGRLGHVTQGLTPRLARSTNYGLRCEFPIGRPAPEMVADLRSVLCRPAGSNHWRRGRFRDRVRRDERRRPIDHLWTGLRHTPLTVHRPDTSDRGNGGLVTDTVATLSTVAVTTERGGQADENTGFEFSNRDAEVRVDGTNWDITAGESNICRRLVVSSRGCWQWEPRTSCRHRERV